MPQYFYSLENNILGPFSKDELKTKDLSRDTKVWYYGLERWTKLSEIDELRELVESIPPDLKTKISIIDASKSLTHESIIDDNQNNKIKQKGAQNVKRSIVIILSVLIVGAILYIVIKNQKKNNLYKNISSSAYISNTDFEMYVTKFYRDAEIYGIYPKKPKITIIKFAKLDQMTNTTHLHGISFGIDDDERIEIYINPSTWESFNKPMRYYLMYHELAHDVLNLDDLDLKSSNEHKLMYPAIATYKNITMDDFIEQSHYIFEEVSSK